MSRVAYIPVPGNVVVLFEMTSLASAYRTDWRVDHPPSVKGVRYVKPSLHKSLFQCTAQSIHLGMYALQVRTMREPMMKSYASSSEDVQGNLHVAAY